MSLHHLETEVKGTGKGKTGRRLILNVESKDRDNGTPENFISNVQMRNSFLQDIESIAIHEVIVPNTMYNVNVSNNRLVVKVYDDAVRTTLLETLDVLLSPGYYTISTFNASLKLLLDGATGLGHIYTSVQNTITGKLTLSNDRGFIDLDLTLSLLNMLSGHLVNPVNATQALLGSRLVDLRGVVNLSILTNLSTHSLNNSGDHNNKFISVPMNKAFGETVFYEPPNAQFYEFNSNLNELRIQLVDENNKQVDLNGFDWKVSFVLNY